MRRPLLTAAEMLVGAVGSVVLTHPWAAAAPERHRLIVIGAPFMGMLALGWLLPQGADWSARRMHRQRNGSPT